MKNKISCGLAMTTVFYTSFIVLFGFAVSASEFGSRAQSRDFADRAILVYEEHGIVAAIEFVHDRVDGLGDERLGVNLIHQGRLVADNREPEMVGSDYTTVIDLHGERLWPRVQNALGAGDEEVILRWTHYDTGAPYAYHCVLRGANDGQVVAMVCR